MVRRRSKLIFALRPLAVVVLALGVLSAPVLERDTGPAPAASTDRLTVDASVADGGWFLTEVVPADDAVLAGATWEHDASQVQLRTRTGDGWGDWMPFHVQDDHAPDDHVPGEEAAHAADDDGHVSPSDPLWIGRVEQLQVRADAPGRVHLDLVRMDDTPLAAHTADGARPGAAIAAAGPPDIVPRSAWDPEGRCRPSGEPEYGDIRMAHVHHTVMYPRYAPEEADDVVRALCLFHTELRGWSDLGYNFLIDKYGRIYEGRAGGMGRPVVGAHAAGFNAASVGVSFVGDYDTNEVPDEAMAALDRLLAWKFAEHQVNPLGRTRVMSTGGEKGLSRFDAGAVVVLPTIVGHRDTGAATLCPGRYLYAAMEGTPQRTADLMVAAGVELPPEDPPPLVVRDDEDDSVEEDHPDPGEPVTSAAAGDPEVAVTLPSTGWGAVALSLLTLCIAGVLGEVTTRRRRRR